MKTRIIDFFEVESRIRDLVVEIHRSPMDDKLVIEKGAAFPVILRLCISQLTAGNSASYPEKSKHLNILNTASEFIKYKTNTCTTEEIRIQVTNANVAFGALYN